MGLIKLIIKLLVLPLIVAVTLIQWVGIFFTQFSTVIFNLLAGLMFLITIAGWMFGISAGAETLQLLAVAFVVFIIPHIAEKRKYQSEATVKCYQKLKADAEAGDPEAMKRYEAHLAKRREDYHKKKAEKEDIPA